MRPVKTHNKQVSESLKVTYTSKMKLLYLTVIPFVFN